MIIFLIRFTVSEPERRTGLYPEDIPLQGLLALEVEDGHGDAAELVEGFAHEHAWHFLDWWGHVEVVIEIFGEKGLNWYSFTSWKMLQRA